MADYIWNAAGGGDWNTAADWTPNGTPGAADTASFATGGSTYVVTGDANAASISVDTDAVSFEGQLTLGDGSANPGLAAIDNGSVVVGSTSFVLDNSTVDFAAGTLLEVDGQLVAIGGTADVALVTGTDANWTDAAAVTLNQLYVNQGGTYAGDVVLNDGGNVTLDTSATFGGGTLTLAGSGLVYMANAGEAASGSYGLSEAISVATPGASLTLATDPGVTLSVSGGISGAGLVDVNSGSVVLAGGNTYSGGTIVDGAALTLAGVAAAGTGAVFLTGGSSLASLADSTGAAGAQTVVATEGADTVTATAGHLTVFASGTSTLLFQGGADSSTVVGGAGILTATGGAGGDVIYGSTSGHDLLNSGTGPTTLVDAFGGTLIASGAASDVLVAAGGNTTLSGVFSTGANIFFTSGTGTTDIQSGAGLTTIVAGGAVNSISGGVGTQDVFLIGGTSQLDFTFGFEGGTMNVTGFAAGDSLHLADFGSGEAQADVGSAVINSGNTILTLSDNTHVVLFGFIGVTAATFV